MSFKNKKVHYAWINVLVCSLVMLETGFILHTMNLFLPQIRDAFAVDTTRAALVMTIQNLCMVFFIIPAGKLVKRFKGQYVFGVAVLLQGLCALLYGLATSVVQMYFIAVVMGCMTTFTMQLMTPILVNRWFETNRQFAVSFIIVFYAVGGTVANQVISRVIAAHGWRVGYFTIAVICSVITAPVVFFFMKNEPEDLGLKKYVNPRGQAAAERRNGGVEPFPLTYRQMLRHRSFLFACVYGACMNYVISFQSHISSFGLSLGYAASVGALGATMVALFGIPSKLLVGVVNAKVGLVKSTALFVMCAFVGHLMWIFCGTGAENLFVTGSALFGITIAIQTVQVPMLSFRLYGNSPDYADLFSMAGFLGGAVGQMGNLVTSSLYDHFESYVPALTVHCVLMITAMLTIYLAVKHSVIKAENA